jgi:hypothetical protein
MKKLIISALCFGFATLAFAQADLKVESLRFATEPAIGGPGLTFPVIYITVKNDGNKPAIGTIESATNGYMIDLILSGDNSAPVRFAPLVTAGRYPEDCLLVGGRISNTVTIQPYQTYTYKMPDMKILASVDLRNPCGLGKFNIGVVLDPGLKVYERSETNNTAFKEFKLVCR